MRLDAEGWRLHNGVKASVNLVVWTLSALSMLTTISTPFFLFLVSAGYELLMDPPMLLSHLRGGGERTTSPTRHGKAHRRQVLAIFLHHLIVAGWAAALLTLDREGRATPTLLALSAYRFLSYGRAALLPSRGNARAICEAAFPRSKTIVGALSVAQFVVAGVQGLASAGLFRTSAAEGRAFFFAVLSLAQASFVLSTLAAHVWSASREYGVVLVRPPERAGEPPTLVPIWTPPGPNLSKK